MRTISRFLPVVEHIWDDTAKRQTAVGGALPTLPLREGRKIPTALCAAQDFSGRGTAPAPEPLPLPENSLALLANCRPSLKGRVEDGSIKTG